MVQTGTARRERHFAGSPQDNGGAVSAVIASERAGFLSGQSRWYRECAISSLWMEWRVMFVTIQSGKDVFFP